MLCTARRLLLGYLLISSFPTLTAWAAAPPPFGQDQPRLREYLPTLLARALLESQRQDVAALEKSLALNRILEEGGGLCHPADPGGRTLAPVPGLPRPAGSGPR